VPPDRAFFSAIFYNQYHLSPIVSVLSMRFAIMSCNGGGPICCRTGMPPTVMVDERSTYGPLYANSWQKFILQTQLLDPRPMAYYLVLRAHNMAYAAYMDWIKLMCEPALSVYSKFHPRSLGKNRWGIDAPTFKCQQRLACWSYQIRCFGYLQVERRFICIAQTKFQNLNIFRTN
jgi:hypothetical protein